MHAGDRMRLELVPVIAAVVVALLGLGLLADAALPEEFYVTHERRRRRRTERDRGGEALIGAGVLALATALGLGDRWRYGTVAILVGVVLLAAGTVLNRRYLRELLAFRGPSRRSDATTGATTEESATDRPRIR